MARIIYGINSEGLGHAFRSKAIIDYLKDKNEIMIVTSATPFEILKKYYKNIFKTKPVNAIYEDNKLNVLKSFQNIIFKTEKKSYIKELNQLFKEFRPDIVISDLEPMTAYFSLFKSLPLISIDNMSIYRTTKIKATKRDRINFEATKNFVKTVIPRANHYVICSFFPAELNKKYCRIKKATIIKPVLRKEIIDISDTTPKDYILVYQTSYTHHNLIDILSKVKYQFHAYKLPHKSKIPNIKFRRLGAKTIYRDLANCKAIISNGGFSLISEALYLGKPVFSIPIKGIYEQKLNAIKVQELGFGEWHNKATPEIIDNFIKKIPQYEKRLKSYRGCGNQKAFKLLDALIPQLINSKKYPSKRSSSLLRKRRIARKKVKV